MKFCKDCRHMEQGQEVPKCFNPDLSWVDPVSGVTQYWFCMAQRRSGLEGDCGPEGLRFEPKLSVVA